MPQPRVSIILSTHNGAAHLGEFLSSLSQQVYSFTTVVVRDDHSTDATIEIINNWADSSNIPLILESGCQIGPAKSFFNALAMAPISDVYMFADQDDVWLPGKIAYAVENLVLSTAEHPMLYASRVAIVDTHLQFLKMSQVPNQVGFTSAIYESLFNGCTMAMNHALAQLLLLHVPISMQMHDWWVYLVASGTGTVYFDQRPTMLYRQHSNNVLGAKPNSILTKKRICKALLGPTHLRLQQILELLEIYGKHLTCSAKRDIHWLSKYQTGCLGRILACLTARISRQTRLEEMGTRLAILFNRF